MKSLNIFTILLAGSLAFQALAKDRKSDSVDLDDIKLYDIVKVEQCLDAAYDRVPGYARKREFKSEGDDPIYEFDIESSNDNYTYNVECNAEEGYIIEIEKEVGKDDPYFKKMLRLLLTWQEGMYWKFILARL